jgi:hypothetical protein
MTGRGDCEAVPSIFYSLAFFFDNNPFDVHGNEIRDKDFEKTPKQNIKTLSI